MNYYAFLLLAIVLSTRFLQAHPPQNIQNKELFNTIQQIQFTQSVLFKNAKKHYNELTQAIQEVKDQEAETGSFDKQDLLRILKAQKEAAETLAQLQTTYLQEVEKAFKITGNK